MAERKFSRHSQDNTPPAEPAAPTPDRRDQAQDYARGMGDMRTAPGSDRRASFIDKAKGALGGMLTNVRGAFSRSSASEGTRTEHPDAPFDPPVQPPSVQPAASVQQAEPVPKAPAAPARSRFSRKNTEFDPSVIDNMPSEHAQQTAPSERRVLSDTPALEDFGDDASDTAPMHREPRIQADRTASTGGLPTRGQAMHTSRSLTFSDRMNNGSYNPEVDYSFEEEPVRPKYTGDVVALPKSQPDDDIGDHHAYVPPVEIKSDGSSHSRFKRRNRKPLKLWQKGIITGVCLTGIFVGLLFLTVTLMLSGKMNRINVAGTGNVNDLYFYTEQDSAGNTLVNVDVFTRLTALNDAFEISDVAIQSDEDIVTFLVVGLDSKTGECDAVMLVSIDPQTKKNRTVSVLPELYLKLEEQLDGKSLGSSVRNLYTYGGAQLLSDTLEYNLRMTIDYYFVVSYTAFETAVNHLGGADVTITADEAQWLSGNKVNPQTRFATSGKFTFNGEEALMYVRSPLDGNFARVTRQKTVVSRLMSKLDNYSKLELVSVLYNCLSYVSTDCPAGKLLGFISTAKKCGEYEVKSITVPIEGTYTDGYVGGEYLLACNLTVNADHVREFLYNNDMTYADGGVETNVFLPQLNEVLDVEDAVSDSDLSQTDI